MTAPALRYPKRIPSYREVSRARAYLDSTKGHSCIHCEYADCAVTSTQDSAWGVVGAFKTQTPIDPTEHYGMETK
jgi:hypothetical protein